MTCQLVAAAGLAAEEDVGKAGPVGLFLILSLLIAVFLLGRSMRTHLRRVPLEFPDTTPSAQRRQDQANPDREVLEGEVLDVSDDPPRSRGRGPERPDAPGADAR